MSTDFISAELVDYLNGELSPARRKEIENLLDSSPERARELEEFKQAQQAVRRLRVSDASSDFNIKVQGRIQRKIEELRARGSKRFRTSRERVDAARDGLSAEEIRRRGGKAIGLFGIALMITLPVLGIGLAGAYHYYRDKAEKRRVSERLKAARLRDLARHERREARGSAVKAGVGSDGRVAAMGFVGDREFHLVLHRGPEPGERCVFAYDPEQWRSYLTEVDKRRGLRGYDQLLAAARSARKVKARDGSLLLPPAIYQNFLGAPSGIEALRLVGRTEFWASADLDEYLEVKVRLVPVKPPKRMRLVPE